MELIFILNITYVYTHVYTCVCVCVLDEHACSGVHGCICLSVHMERPEVNVRCLHLLSHWFLRQHPLLNLEFTVSASLAGFWSLKDLPISLPLPTTSPRLRCVPLFLRVQGILSQVGMLAL